MSTKIKMNVKKVAKETEENSKTSIVLNTLGYSIFHISYWILLTLVKLAIGIIKLVYRVAIGAESSNQKSLAKINEELSQEKVK